MTALTSRRFWALAIAVAVVGWAAHDARADAINYGTIGWVDTPTGATPGLVNFVGANGTVNGAGSLNPGQFQVEPAALTGPAVDFDNDQFHIIAFAGPNQSTLITGDLHGSLGAGTSNMLTATIDSSTAFGTSPLPFSLNVPMNVPLTLSTTPGNGTDPSTTIFSAAASPIPEPTSVAIFSVALGSLLFYRRRAVR